MNAQHEERTVPEHVCRWCFEYMDADDYRYPVVIDGEDANVCMRCYDEFFNYIRAVPATKELLERNAEAGGWANAEYLLAGTSVQKIVAEGVYTELDWDPRHEMLPYGFVVHRRPFLAIIGDRVYTEETYVYTAPNGEQFVHWEAGC